MFRIIIIRNTLKANAIHSTGNLKTYSSYLNAFCTKKTLAIYWPKLCAAKENCRHSALLVVGFIFSFGNFSSDLGHFTLFRDFTDIFKDDLNLL